MATTVVYSNAYYEFLHWKTGKYEYYTNAEFLTEYIPMDVSAIIIEFSNDRPILDLLPLSVRALIYCISYGLPSNCNDNLPPILKDYWITNHYDKPVMLLKNMPHYLELLRCSFSIIKLKYPLCMLFSADINTSNYINVTHAYISIESSNILHMHDYLSRTCTHVSIIDKYGKIKYSDYFPINIECVALTIDYGSFSVCDNLPLLKKLKVYKAMCLRRIQLVYSSRNIIQRCKIRTQYWDNNSDIYNDYYHPRLRSYVRK
jgi:hypothetical protein